jgi:hypothetical protein
METLAFLSPFSAFLLLFFTILIVFSAVAALKSRSSIVAMKVTSFPLDSRIVRTFFPAALF